MVCSFASVYRHNETYAIKPTRRLVFEGKSGAELCRRRRPHGRGEVLANAPLSVATFPDR
jgi:hypothetical protein